MITKDRAIFISSFVRVEKIGKMVLRRDNIIIFLLVHRVQIKWGSIILIASPVSKQEDGDFETR